LGAVEGSGNRIGQYNTITRGQYELPLIGGRLKLLLAGAYAQGGVSDRERLRDTWSIPGEKERSRFGYKGVDVLAEAHLSLLKDRLKLPFRSSEAYAINNLNLLLSTDFTRDLVRYVESKFDVPQRYRQSALTNVGALGQITARLLERRIGLTVGGRFDSYRGAALSENQLDRLDSGMLQGTEGAQLCAGRPCHQRFSYRVGLTSSLLQNIGRFRPDKAILNDLYLKAFLGTAFKAPAPLFLYHDDSFGSRPINPNPGLLPEDVRSIEVQLGAKLLDRTLESSLVFFDNLLLKKVAFQLETVGIIAKNAQDVQSRGLEASLRWRWGPLDAQASLGFQRSHRLFDEPDVVNIRETFAFPDLTAHGSVSYDLPWVKTFVELEAQYVGLRVGHPMNKRGADSEENKYTLSPYTLLHLNVASHEFKLFGDKLTTVTFSLRNLLNTGYQFSGFQPFYGIDIPGEPRLFLLSIRQSL
jgi:outer membrane receptor protein involved in Fe transport